MRRFLLLVLPLVALAACERTPSPDALLDGMVERYTADIEGISDLAVTGEGIVAYFRRTGPDSLLAFDVRVVPMDSSAPPTEEAGFVLDYLPNVTQWARGLRGHARVTGERRVGGVPTYVLETDDVRAFIGLPPGASDEGLADLAQVFVETETFRVRGLRLESRPDTTMERPLVQETFYDDYREVDGHMLPFEIRRHGEGLNQLIPEEYRIVMQGNLTIERAQTQTLPAGQREAALADIDRRARELETGESNASFEATRVAVNPSIPDSLFAPPPGP